MQDYRIANTSMAHRVADLVRALSCEGKQWVVTIKRYKKQRSLPQNAIMWKWYTIIGNELGYTKDEMHDVLREKFLPWEIVNICGVDKKKLTSTSDPSFTVAMESEYLKHIDRFSAQELGILLPHPEDNAYDDWAKGSKQ